MIRASNLICLQMPFYETRQPCLPITPNVAKHGTAWHGNRKGALLLGRGQMLNYHYMVNFLCSIAMKEQLQSLSFLCLSKSYLMMQCFNVT